MYKCEECEDERLSPYIPEWLLAWGANMNIQFCTAAGFLGYISKYVPKPEPSGAVADTEALRERENRQVSSHKPSDSYGPFPLHVAPSDSPRKFSPSLQARQVRYINARKVGAPEVVYDLFSTR